MLSITKNVVLLLPIFITCVFGSTAGSTYNKELGCPEIDYKLRGNAYMKLQEKSGKFCISCIYTRGGPVNKNKY